MTTPSRREWRGGWRGVALVLAVIAVLAIDCFNATQSTSWIDLGEAPHLAATHAARPAPARLTRISGTGVTVTPQRLWLVPLLAALGLGLVAEVGVTSSEHHRLPPRRGPPRLRTHSARC
jgi:hypothetical protein